MYKKTLPKKGLALVTIILLIGLSTIPVAGNISTEKNSSSVYPLSLGSSDDCWPNFFGQLGDHDWFITIVLIGFTYRDNVDKIYYSITEDNEPKWKTYGDPFNYVNEGLWYFQYKWVDIWGNTTMGETLFLKIDLTPPTIKLSQKVKARKELVIFTAKANDDSSGIERVDFYMDGEPAYTDYETPYEYTYSYEEDPNVEERMVEAITYDYAGYSSNTNVTPKSHSKMFLNGILNKLQIFNQLFFQLLRIIIVPFQR